MAKKSTNLDLIKKIIDSIEKNNIDAALPDFRKLIRYTGKFREDEIKEIYKFGGLFKKEPIKTKSDRFISEIDKRINAKKHENLYFIKSEIVGNAWGKENALAFHIEALKIFPENTELLNTKAIILSSLKRYEEALEEINKAIKIEPDNAKYINTKVNMLGFLKRHEEALEEINKAIKIEPDNAEYLDTKANRLGSLKRYEEALEEINKAIKIEPDNAEYLDTKTIILSSLKRYEEALEEINKAIKIEPDNAKYINTKVNMLGFLKRYEEALEEIKKAIKIEPNNAKYIITKAIILLKLGKYEPAIKDIEKAIEIEPENPNYISMLNTVGLQQQINEQFKESKKETESIKKQSEEFKGAINKLKDDIQNNKIKIIEFLGIFAAIISFTLAAVTITKSHSLPNSLIIISGLGLALVAFVLAIDVIISFKPKKDALEYLLFVILAMLVMICISLYMNHDIVTCGTGTTYDLDWKVCVSDTNNCNMLTEDNCIQNSNCRIVNAKGSPECPECVNEIKRCFPK
ncbi:MAG: hypothetical protein KAJ91_03835 [Candidatus Aenigmarchaeota archaeon]|nr:hypothetical protein [Candidatus Aenigmarchaeota archaeon]